MKQAWSCLQGDLPLKRPCPSVHSVKSVCIYLLFGGSLLAAARRLLKQSQRFKLESHLVSLRSSAILPLPPLGGGWSNPSVLRVVLLGFCSALGCSFAWPSSFLLASSAAMILLYLVSKHSMGIPPTSKPPRVLSHPEPVHDNSLSLLDFIRFWWFIESLMVPKSWLDLGIRLQNEVHLQKQMCEIACTSERAKAATSGCSAGSRSGNSWTKRRGSSECSYQEPISTGSSKT